MNERKPSGFSIEPGLGFGGIRKAFARHDNFVAPYPDELSIPLEKFSVTRHG